MDKSQAHDLLLDAARTGRTEDAKAAIDAGADVNARNNSSGDTPLHRAAAWDNPYIIRLLIDNGADVNIRDVTDVTPLHEAIENESRAAVRMLIDAGADINAKNSDQQTPMQVAQDSGNKQIVAMLVEAMKNTTSHTDRIDKQRGKASGPEIGG